MKTTIKNIWGDEEVKPERAVEVEKVLTNIEKRPLHSQKLIIATFIKYLSQYDISPEILQKYRLKLVELAKEQSGLTNVQTDKEKKNWITWDKIAELPAKLKIMIDKAKAENKHVRAPTPFFNLFQKYIVMMLYTQIPPLRADYVDTILIGSGNAIDDNIHNVMDITKKQFILRQYKTEKKWGTKNIDLPEILVEALKEWACLNTSGWLLVTIKEPHTPIKPNSLSMYLSGITTELLGKNISVQMLRKIYVSHKYPISIQKVKEKKNDAWIMGHGESTQDSFYRKDLSLEESGDEDCIDE